jgi:hypothetical protein
MCNVRFIIFMPAWWQTLVCSMWSMLTRQGASWVVVLLPPRILGLKCNTVRSHDVTSSSNGLLYAYIVHSCTCYKAAQTCVTGQTGCTNLDSLCGRGSCLEHSGWISAAEKKVGILIIDTGAMYTVCAGTIVHVHVHVHVHVCALQSSIYTSKRNKKKKKTPITHCSPLCPQ